METKKTIREFWGPEGCINDICFSNDGRWIIAASDDKTIRIWDLPTSHLIDAIRLNKPCTALDMSATGEYLAAKSRKTSQESQFGPINRSSSMSPRDKYQKMRSDRALHRLCLEKETRACWRVHLKTKG